jgi:hypothetical protein
MGWCTGTAWTFKRVRWEMLSFVLVLLVLTVVLWSLVKLREFRDKQKNEKLPMDQGTILLGLFYTLSEACIAYHRDHGHYPPTVSGAPDGLIEKGYLQKKNLADMTAAVSLYSMVVSEKVGYGVCLANTTAELTTLILDRATMSGSRVTFLDFKNGQYVTLTMPIKNDFINLTLPLPHKPKKTR